MSKSNIDLTDLTSFDGITKLKGSKIPTDLEKRLKSDLYKVEDIYQADDIPKWKKWKNILDKSKSKDKWLYYACPLSLAEKVLEDKDALPFDEFYPRVLGEKAIYLFSSAEQAARVALKFGIEKEGFIISCRVALGEIFKSKKTYTKATAPPKGHDSVFIPKGIDLGNGTTDFETYTIFEKDRIMVRYITHITSKL